MLWGLGDSELDEVDIVTGTAFQDEPGPARREDPRNGLRQLRTVGHSHHPGTNHALTHLVTHHPAAGTCVASRAYYPSRRSAAWPVKACAGQPPSVRAGGADERHTGAGPGTWFSFRTAV